MSEMNPDRAAAEALGATFEEPEPDRESTVSESSSTSGGGRASSVKDMLSSTRPAKSPQQASGSLDFDTPWYNHLEVGLEKATGADGTPAWVNLVVGCILLVVQEGDVPMPSRADSDDEEPEADGGVMSV